MIINLVSKFELQDNLLCFTCATNFITTLNVSKLKIPNVKTFEMLRCGHSLIL